jgi:hypothetical protein
MKPRANFAGLFLAASLASPAVADITVYTTPLLPEPSVTSTGNGFATITIDTDLMTMRVEASFADLLGTTTIAHIHCCTATPFSGNAAPATTLPSFEGFPTGVTSGSYDHLFDMTQGASWNPDFLAAQGGIPGAFTAFVSGLDEGRAYLNILGVRRGRNPWLPHGGGHSRARDLRPDAGGTGRSGLRGQAAPPRLSRKLAAQTASSSARFCATAKSTSPV